MRTKLLVAFFVTFSFINQTFAQGYLADANTLAIFVPPAYNPEDHILPPDIAYLKEPNKSGFLNTNTFPIKVDFGKDGKTVIVKFGSPSDLYGTGEVYGSLRRNGDRTMFYNIDNWGYNHYSGKMLYESMPWVMGVRTNGTAFGVIFDTTFRSSIDCLNEKVMFKTEGPPFRLIAFDRKSPQEVLKTLAKLTGKMDLPPLWALGYHQCRYSYSPDKRVKEVAGELRKRNIPCDAIWLDIHYLDGYRLFTFHPKLFPDPEELATYLHTNDFKLVTIVDCGIKVDENYFAYQELLKAGCYVRNATNAPYVGRVWPGDCVFPDTLTDKGFIWWSDKCSDFVKRGIDGIWLDMNEPSIFGGPDHTMPKDNWHCVDSKYKGQHSKYHNLYGYSICKATKEGLMKAHPDKRPFILTRANFLGGQRFAAMWTGDNRAMDEHLLASIPMSLNIGLSGQPFNGPDIGGFSGKTTGEMLSTWMAMGVFFPFVRNHADNNTPHQEPYAYDEKTENACRTALNRRYRLLPAIYTIFQEASETGLPVMQPAFFMDLLNLDIRAQEKVFLLGNDILVVPAFAKGEKLPIEGWKEIKFDGETTDEYQAKLYLRPGAAIPMLPKPIQSTVEYDTSELVVVANLDKDGKATGRFYDDEHDGFGYKKDAYGLYDIQVTGNSVKLNKVKGSWPVGNRKITLKVLK